MLPFSSFLTPHVLRIGSTRAIVMDDKKKVLFDSPARIAVSLASGKILAFGESAVDLSLLGAPDIKIIPLFHQGIPVDTLMCREYLLWMRDSFLHSRVQRVLPSAIVPVVPVGFPTPYQHVFEHALRSAHFIPLTSHAAVLGDAWTEAGEKILDEEVVIIRIGATQTQLALIGKGVILSQCAIPIGGEDLDRQFVRAIRTNYEISVPISSVIDIKESYTKAQAAKTPFSVVVRGKHTKRSDVASVTLGSDDVLPIYTQFFDTVSCAIVTALRMNMHYAPARTEKKPLLLSGGMSLFSIAQTTLESLLESPVQVVSRPTLASVLGIVSKITYTSSSR